MHSPVLSSLSCPPVLLMQVGRKLAAVRRELVGFTDARVKLCTEVVTGLSFAAAPHSCVALHVCPLLHEAQATQQQRSCAACRGC